MCFIVWLNRFSYQLTKMTDSKTLTVSCLTIKMFLWCCVFSEKQVLNLSTTCFGKAMYNIIVIKRHAIYIILSATKYTHRHNLTIGILSSNLISLWCWFKTCTMVLKICIKRNDTCRAIKFGIKNKSECNREGCIKTLS